MDDDEDNSEDHGEATEINVVGDLDVTSLSAIPGELVVFRVCH